MRQEKREPLRRKRVRERGIGGKLIWCVGLFYGFFFDFFLGWSVFNSVFFFLRKTNGK